MEKNNLITEAGQKMVEKKAVGVIGGHPEKLQLSSFYGKFGGDPESTRLGKIAALGLDSDGDMLDGKFIEPIGRVVRPGYEGGMTYPAYNEVDLSNMVDLRDEMIKEAYSKIVPIENIVGPRQNGKSVMSLKQLAEMLGVDLDSLTVTEDSVYIDDPDFPIMPEDFEGLEPGHVMVIDSMKAMNPTKHKRSLLDMNMEDLEQTFSMSAASSEPRLSRTEKRKQQRAKIREERKLRKQLKKDAEKEMTVHQTIMEANQITKNNTQYSEDVLRGVGAGIYYDDDTFNQLKRETLQSSLDYVPDTVDGAPIVEVKFKDEE